MILLQGCSHKIPYKFPVCRRPTLLSAVAFKSRDFKKFIQKHAEWACAGLVLDAGATGVRWGEAHEFHTPAGEGEGWFCSLPSIKTSFLVVN